MCVNPPDRPFPCASTFQIQNSFGDSTRPVVPEVSTRTAPTPEPSSGSRSRNLWHSTQRLASESLPSLVRRFALSRIVHGHRRPTANGHFAGSRQHSRMPRDQKHPHVGLPSRHGQRDSGDSTRSGLDRTSRCGDDGPTPTTDSGSDGSCGMIGENCDIVGEGPLLARVTFHSFDRSYHRAQWIMNSQHSTTDCASSVTTCRPSTP